jgi:hypothetical protein
MLEATMDSDHLAGRVPQLLADIDAGGEPRAGAARRELVAAGVAAMEAVLRSLDAINDALLRQEAMEANMERLRRRVEILAAMRDERVVMPVLRALVDSSMAVQVLAAQLAEIQREVDREIQARGGFGLEAGIRPDLEEMFESVEQRRDVACRLKATSVRALVSLGELALPHVERNLPRAPRCAQRPLRAVRARILNQWWKFWLWI